MKMGSAYTKSDLQAVSDNPEWTAEDFARAQPFHVVFPDLAKSLYGFDVIAPSVDEANVAVMIDRDLVDKFKGDGPGWEARLNDALRRAVETAA